MSLRAVSTAMYDVAVQMWHDEKSAKAIANAIGRSPDLVRRLVRNHRADFPPRYGKATPEKVERMRVLRETRGMTCEQIAAEVGVSKSTVQRHMRKETR